LYPLIHTIVRIKFRILWRRRIIGWENVPLKGAVILASNHASLADPLLVATAVTRPVFFMAKQELFDIPGLGWLIRQLNAFPIRRMERDMGAFRMAQRVLTSGNPLILFPEGTRQKTGELGRARAGVGMLAIRTGCPVVPVYVHNSRRIGRLARLSVVFGPPLSTVGESDYQVFSDKVMAAIAGLKEKYFGTS